MKKISKIVALAIAIILICSVSIMSSSLYLGYDEWASNSTLLVIIKPEYSKIGQVLTPEDFDSDLVSDVSIASEIREDQTDGSNIFALKLKEPSDINMVKLTKIALNNKMVAYAHPDMIHINGLHSENLTPVRYMENIEQYVEDRTFSDKDILVVIKPEHSKIGQVLTPEDFDSDLVSDVRIIWEIKEDQTDGSNIFLVTLKNPGTDNVFKLIKSCAKKDFVLIAGPNFTDGKLDEEVTRDIKVCGDADFDGRVTVTDARTVLRISAKLEKTSKWINILCDMDGDKKLTAKDARTILRTSAKLIPIKYIW